MKKNSSGFTEKVYCLERNLPGKIGQLFTIFTNKRDVRESGFSANKNIEAVQLLVTVCM